MEADVLNAVRSQIAYLSGSRNSPVIIVNVAVSETRPQLNKKLLELCLQYLISILSDEVLNEGLNTIVDAQKCGWRLARCTAEIVAEILTTKLRKLYLIRPDGFWDKQRLENCAKSQKNKDITIVTKSRLYKHFQISELPESLGGTLAHNHDEWLRNRMRIEEFKKSTNNTIKEQIQTLHDKLLDKKVIRLTNTGQNAVQPHCTYAAMNDEVQKKIRSIMANGNILLIELNDSLGNNYCISRDIVDAKEMIKNSLNKLERKQADLGMAWHNFERNMADLNKLSSLEKGVEHVTNWILTIGQTLLNKQKTIGTDLQSSEELRRAHEKLEMQCCKTYGLYAELIYRIKNFKNLRDTQAYFDLKSQKELMDFICGCFAARLERRRYVLISCVRFYRFVSTYFNRTGNILETFTVGNKLEDYGHCDVSLQKLKSCSTNLEIIATELSKEGEKLSDLLSMPVKDAFGHEIEFDYSQDIAKVRKVLDTTLTHRKEFMKSVEQQMVTLERVSHISAYEKDAAVALKWLEDLQRVMDETHSYVGCNVFEIQTQKEELQSIQETAKAIYNYGYQLLNAALALRLSSKFNEEGNRDVLQCLEDRWKHLDTVSQEQMTRLRVSAVFHRTTEEQCQKLKTLKELVSTITVIEDKGQQMYDLRLHLMSRENLIVEIGRMVRLGRLLKSRLKEPFKSTGIHIMKKLPENEADSATNNLMATNAITGKLNEVSKVAEALDIALRDTQHCLEMGGNCSSNSNSLDRKTDGNVSIDSRGSIDELNSITKCSTEDESFVTASECTFTPQSHSSAYETASEGGLISPWWASSSVEKSSFETCSSSDMDSEVPSMQLLTGIISSASASFDDSEHSFLSTLQTPFLCDVDDEIDKALAMSASYLSESSVETQCIESDTKEESKSPFNVDAAGSSWSLVTKHTVKGCL